MSLAKLKSRSLFIALSLFTSGLVAQQTTDLPRGMTPEEAGMMKDYLLQLNHNRQIPIPPPGKVRNMAEWEEVQALVITWAGQATILREIVRNAVKECKVLIVTTDSVNVSDILTTAGISLDSVRFVDTAFNTIWVCDYGPSCVYKNDVDSLWIVDWTYNRPRPADDQVPVALADFLNYQIFEATDAPFDWVHTGGNHLQTGTGTLFSSNLVFDENPGKTEAEIDTIAKKFLGINDYVKFPTLPFDGIHHLDMHMRVIDEETIIFGEYPEGVSDGPQIEENIQYLQDSIKTSFGSQFNIIRMPMPPDQSGRYPDQGGNYRTYTNAVFINKTLLVPTYQEKYDTTALRIYRDNLPGYNVVGINCNSIISQLGALHCITKLIGVDEPLYISHARLRDVEDTVAYYPVSAYIRHRDGIQEASLFYRTSKDSVYSEVPMMLLDTAGNIWASLIPAYPAGTEVQYYISADANNGKHQVRPIVAPEGYFKFNVLGEPQNQPPVGKITDPVDGAIFSIDLGHIPITFEANDPDGNIEHAKLIINFEEIADLDTLPYTVDWTFPGTGTYFAHVQVIDNDSAFVYSDQVKITVEESTGVKELSDVDGIKLSPNPVVNQLTINFKEKVENGHLQVFDLTGRQMLLPISIENDRAVLDFSLLASQLYVVRMNINGKMFTIKVAKT